MTGAGKHRQFEGKTAIVTGGTSGIGAAVVEALAASGAFVLFCGLEDDKGEAVATAAPGGRARYLRADVREDRDMAALVAAALEQFGRLDLAVNNAGISHPPMKLADIPPDLWRDVMATNADGVFHAMRHEIPAMLGSGGAIVNIASILAARGAPWIAAYGASKHAVIGLTQSAARDYATAGIRINAVLPGPVDTPMFRRAMLEIGGDLTRYSGGLPPGGPGRPEDIVSAILYLLGDAAAYVNGASLVVDGGVSAG